jgi:hypothetical protein
MIVLAEGKEGDLTLGFPGDEPDTDSPLTPVIASGMVETTQGAFTISVREESSGQVNVEIVSGSGTRLPDHYEEKRRWTYSAWSPGDASPASGAPVREVAVDAGLTLAFAPPEKRIWVHERSSGVVRLIPVTNYYNELMIRTGVRDPRVALVPALLWDRLKSFRDDDLRGAFLASNAVRPRVSVQPSARPVRRGGIPLFITHLFRKRD